MPPAPVQSRLAAAHTRRLAATMHALKSAPPLACTHQGTIMTGGRDGRVKFWDTTDLSDTTEPLKIFDLASLTPDRAIPAIRSVCFDGYVLA